MLPSFEAFRTRFETFQLLFYQGFDVQASAGPNELTPF